MLWGRGCFAVCRFTVKTLYFAGTTTEQKTKFSIKGFFTKCNQIRWKVCAGELALFHAFCFPSISTLTQLLSLVRRK